MSDDELIVSTLARMREAMLAAHPEQLMASVSDVYECALNLEAFQKELLGKLDQLEKEKEGWEAGYNNLLDEHDNSLKLAHQAKEAWEKAYDQIGLSMATEIDQLQDKLAQAEAERDAYKKAKAENDERYMLERDEARQKLAAAVGALQYVGGNMENRKDDTYCKYARDALERVGEK